jgi:integrase
MTTRELINASHATAVAAVAERPLRPELIATARDYMDAARAENTRRAYRRSWAAFEAWCARESRHALPANPETVVAWMGWAAKGLDGQRPWNRSTINQALSAIVLAQRQFHGERIAKLRRRRDNLQAGGHAVAAELKKPNEEIEALSTVQPFDHKHPLIAEEWSGISRSKAKQDAIRQTLPILASNLRTMLEGLGYGAGKLPADARDAALLALGWQGRSELVGLDWEKVGSGTGCLRIDERGLIIALAVSKGSQTEPVPIAVPHADMPAAFAAVQAWASIAGLQPGEPVFRPVDKRQCIGAGRLTDRSVSRIIKARVRAYAIVAGRTEEEADVIAERMSGHSMRSGYATAAAAANVPSYRIQQHTRHKSAEMVSRYVREADKWTKNGLKGMGF